MKKILCFGLVLVLLLSSLAACGGTTPKPGPETTGSEGGGNTEPVTEAPEGFPLVKNGTAAVLRYSVFAEDITCSSGTLDHDLLQRNYEAAYAQGQRQVGDWKSWLNVA